MDAKEIKEIAKLLNIGIPVVVAIIVFVVCIANIDKLLILLSAIQKLFAKVSSSARKGSISNAIRGKLLKSSKSFSGANIDILTPDVKITWIKNETPEAFIKNNQVIVRMAQNNNPHENFVNAVTLYVGQALLPRAKKYIDPQIYKLSSMEVSRKIIINGDIDAIDYFDDKFLLPIIQQDLDAKEIYEQLRTIDKNGMFINILLNEYSKVAKKVFPDQPDPLLIAESKEFLTYLHRIALGAVSDIGEFRFQREYFKVHIFLTAKTITYLRSGIRPYLKHMSESLSSGTETLYIFGLGTKINIATEITDALIERDFRITKIVPHYYKHKGQEGRTVAGVCYEVIIFTDEV